MTSRLQALAASTAVALGYSAGQYFNKPKGDGKVHNAICVLRPDGNTNVHGIVKFSQVGDAKITIEADLEGLAPGKHGFHINEFGNLTNGSKTTGGHYDPFDRKHGGPTSAMRHAGDLGSITAGADGKAHVRLTDDMVKLNGPTSVVGRSVVVQSGGATACGVIGVDESHPFMLHPLVQNAAEEADAKSRQERAEVAALEGKPVVASKLEREPGIAPIMPK